MYRVFAKLNGRKVQIGEADNQWEAASIAQEFVEMNGAAQVWVKQPKRHNGR